MNRNRLLMVVSICLTVLAASIFNSCKSDKVYKVVDLESRLGISLTSHKLSEIHIDEGHFLGLDWVRPYNTYISFVADSNTVLHIFSELEMVRYNLNIVKWKDATLCLYSKPIDLKIWNVKPRYFVSQALKYQSQLSWWQPDTVNHENSFVLYYKLLGGDKGKVVKCNEHHDGRIVGQFLPDGKRVFILIEIQF